MPRPRVPNNTGMGAAGPNVYGVSRAIWDHPEFADERFTEREAWLWLIGAAAWKEIRTRGPVGPVALQRGEFSFSIRFLAERWDWSKDKVHRFMTRLKKRDMIRDSERDSNQVYFICNYNKFQVVGLPKRDSDCDAMSDTNATAPRHSRDKEEAGETGKTGKAEDGATPPAIAPVTADAPQPPASTDPKKADPSPEVVRLPTNRYGTTGEEVVITEAALAEWIPVYPGVNVRQQLGVMRQWLLTHQAQRKTTAGMLAFVTRWLGKEQNDCGRNGAQPGSFAATGGRSGAGSGSDLPPPPDWGEPGRKLADRIGALAYAQWFGGGKVELVLGDPVRVIADSPFRRNWIAKNYSSMLSHTFGAEVVIECAREAQGGRSFPQQGLVSHG